MIKIHYRDLICIFGDIRVAVLSWLMVEVGLIMRN